MLEILASQHPLFFPFFVFILGLCFGSFANVVIYRVPLQKSVVKPRSACPQCKKPILWYQNIPVFSWLFLRGRCANCKAPISVRYPVVELLSGLLFLALFLKFGFSWTFLEMLIFGYCLLIVSFIDIDHMILPDIFTLSGVVIGLLGAVLNPERAFMSSLLGVIVGGGFLYALAYLYLVLRGKDGMGGGDIKLLAWIGAVLGVQAIPLVVMVSSVVGSIIGVAVAIRSTDGLKSGIPFGPYLVLGALIDIFFGQQITSWYLGLVLPQG